MIRGVSRACVCAALLVAWARPASAQWYVNPYIGKAFKIENPFLDPEQGTKPDKATVFGIAGGTSPLGRIGFEIDFQRVNNMFRTGEGRYSPEQGELLTGDNYMQSLTAAVHFGVPLANGRVRPYGVFGGGLNYVKLGTEYVVNVDAFLDLPPQQQTAIQNCFVGLGVPDPTLAQVQGCGVPLLGETEAGYRGILQFGGGVAVKLASHLAATADVRYFKEIPTDDGGPFTFWRFVVGVVIHQ